MKWQVVIMGVAGCGKSSLGQALAQATGASLIEGDDYHSDTSRDKMRQGIPLTDSDRQDWLNTLGQLIGNANQNTVLTCSALKRTYRDTLRAQVPNLCFIFLEITPANALSRVTERSASHFFPGHLVDSQFAILESPINEAKVLALNAVEQLEKNVAEAVAWLQQEIQS